MGTERGMTYESQVSEIKRLDTLLTVALRTGSRADQLAYERARKAYCVRYGLPYVAPIWPARRIAS
jgi:hypothetical protein